MNLKNVKKLVELLIIKKHDSLIRSDEILLLNELQYLLSIYNSIFSVNNSIKCKCELNHDTIKREIDNNICFTCGLPLADSKTK